MLKFLVLATLTVLSLNLMASCSDMNFETPIRTVELPGTIR